jgi:hypothetical protein
MFSRSSPQAEFFLMRRDRVRMHFAPRYHELKDGGADLIMI